MEIEPPLTTQLLLKLGLGSIAVLLIGIIGYSLLQCQDAKQPNTTIELWNWDKLASYASKNKFLYKTPNHTLDIKELEAQVEEEIMAMPQLPPKQQTH